MADPTGPPDEVFLRFVADDWSAMRWPVFLRPFGFSHRFDVIQAAFHGGVDHRWVDRSVWLRLADYMALEGRRHRVLVVPDTLKAGFARDGLGAAAAAILPGAAARAIAAIERHGLSLDDFLATAAAAPDGEWDPPAAIFVLDERAVRLAMTAQRSDFTRGPDFRHDSATYVFHARRDLSGAVIAFLQLAPGATAWTFDLLVNLAEAG